jgi:hypothetical protein
MSRKISEEDAVKAMLERGTQPLEPFPGTQKPWRCQCLTCGEISLPRYNDVINKGTGACNGSCRSKKISAKLTRDAAEAVAAMQRNGWEPVGDYPGAGKPWRSRCTECGVIKPKRLSHVQNGTAGCTNCAGRDVTNAAARKVMVAAGLEPLIEYPRRAASLAFPMHGLRPHRISVLFEGEDAGPPMLVLPFGRYQRRPSP